MSGNPSPPGDTARDVMTWYFRPDIMDDMEPWYDLLEEISTSEWPPYASTRYWERHELAVRMRESYEDRIYEKKAGDMLNGLLHLALDYVDWDTMAKEVDEEYFYEICHGLRPSIDDKEAAKKKKRRSRRCRPEGRPRVPGRSRSTPSPWGRSSSIRCWWARTSMGRSATSS